MIAAWDWDLPRESDAQEREIVEFASACGFDTLILSNPTTSMVDRAHELHVDVIDIIDGRADETTATEHPALLQQVLPVEETICNYIEEDSLDQYQSLSHRWFPIVHPGSWLCVANPTARELLKSRIDDALEIADGVAFDGIGFRNQYACFCSHCIDERCAEHPPAPDDHEIIGAHAEQSLVDATSDLFEHAKAIKSDAIVTNHVWPPLRPNPWYGYRLPLDYCSQTISWFYNPSWPLSRVEFEAMEHARRAGEANEFVPFIGLFDEPHLRRPVERVRREIEIALDHGEGNLVFSTLAVPRRHATYRDMIKTVLNRTSSHDG